MASRAYFRLTGVSHGILVEPRSPLQMLEPAVPSQQLRGARPSVLLDEALSLHLAFWLRLRRLFPA